MTSPITVETIVNAPLSVVWDSWNNPAHIMKWAFASDDWEAPDAQNDLRVGGTLKITMAAKDKSTSFDLVGTYTEVSEPHKIAYTMTDGRAVSISFTEVPEGVKVTETFDPESENPEDMQRAGWQSILDNFKKYTESIG